MHYTNYSNGHFGTVSYTVNGDGSYKIDDPAGNLQTAQEVPNYALLIQTAKTSPNHIPCTDHSRTKVHHFKNEMAGNRYNYMQFRTAAGGQELRSVSIDSSMDINVNSYWP